MYNCPVVLSNYQVANDDGLAKSLKPATPAEAVVHN
jgi:hypothetical protein